ncbi:MAG: hypothetical protein H6Q01_805, partial [Acidobacteria bacterium]|nr:hypothetical protein [Acidobacteriota bacterium]
SPVGRDAAIRRPSFGPRPRASGLRVRAVQRDRRWRPARAARAAPAGRSGREGPGDRRGRGPSPVVRAERRAPPLRPRHGRVHPCRRRSLRARRSRGAPDPGPGRRPVRRDLGPEPRLRGCERPGAPLPVSRRSRPAHGAPGHDAGAGRPPGWRRESGPPRDRPLRRALGGHQRRRSPLRGRQLRRVLPVPRAARRISRAQQQLRPCRLPGARRRGLGRLAPGAGPDRAGGRPGPLPEDPRRSPR